MFSNNIHVNLRKYEQIDGKFEVAAYNDNNRSLLPYKSSINSIYKARVSKLFLQFGRASYINSLAAKWDNVKLLSIVPFIADSGCLWHTI